MVAGFGRVVDLTWEFIDDDANVEREREFVSGDEWLRRCKPPVRGGGLG